ncbi:unnamed protein product [Ambrosiozyma monospora]|uniref:Unnamed protein product n=1 Tax=Ambrosiozyma monospora TaxID=43982 RepID=A0A9W6T833_AMBMO|nr:unnamed protein product [Ambrosiozyma monospora]
MGLVAPSETESTPETEYDEYYDSEAGVSRATSPVVITTKNKPIAEIKGSRIKSAKKPANGTGGVKKHGSIRVKSKVKSRARTSSELGSSPRKNPRKKKATSART